MKSQNIVGSGGGGGHTPVTDKNSLQCKTIGMGVDVLCEGPIEGLVAGEKSLFLNDVQLQNDDESSNFSGIKVFYRLGTPDQSHIPNFSSIEAIFSVGTEVTKDKGAVIRTVADVNVNDIKINVGIPSLVRNDSNGDRLETKVSFSIYIQPKDKGWILADTTTVSGKCISTFMVPTRLINITETYGEGPWMIKVVRETDDSETSTYQNKTHFSSYVTIINEKLTYPDTAYIAWLLDAETFGSRIPKRTYEIKGMMLQIPDGYDPIAMPRTYPTIWNGVFKAGVSWSNNPIWVLYDLLTNDRYGLGRDPSRIDKYAFYSAAKYCDEMVPDGFGGEEPRYTFNGVVKKQQDAYHAVEAIASMFHAKTLWTSGLTTLMQDMPAEPTILVSPANVVNGEFNYVGTALKHRNTVVAVAWFDPANKYKKTHEVIDDKEGVRKYGYNKLDIIAYGCTSRGQARRYGRWMLFTEMFQTEVVTYKAGLDHLSVIPGDVIQLQDPDTDLEIEDGGRLKAVLGRQLTLDRPLSIQNTDLTPENSHTISIVLENGDLETKEIVHINEDQQTVILDSDFEPDNMPQIFSMWGLSSNNREPRLYRVTKKKESGLNEFQITALIYLPEKYDIVDGDETFRFDQSEPILGIPTDEMKPPTNLVAEIFSYTKSEALEMGTLLSWTHSEDPRVTHYEVEYFEDGKLPVRVDNTASNTKDVRGIQAGAYGFRVRAVGSSVWSDGLKSAWAVTKDYTVMDDPSNVSGSDILPTPDVTGLEIEGQGNDTIWRNKDLRLSWTLVQQIDYSADDESAGAGTSADEFSDQIKHYVLKIYRTEDGALLHEGISTTDKFVFKYEDNVAKSQAMGFDGPTPLLTVKVRAVSKKTAMESEHDAILVVTNLAPTPVQGLKAETFMGGIRFSWGRNDDLDFSHYIYRCKVEEEPWPTELIPIEEREPDWTETDIWMDILQDTTNYGATRMLSEEERATYPDGANITIEILAVDSFGLISAMVTQQRECDSLKIATIDIDDFAIDASKMFSKVPVLEHEVWTGIPGEHKVSWNKHNLYFAGEKFVIAAGDSVPGEIDGDGYGKQYIYWNHPNTSYSLSDVHPGDAGLLTVEKGFIIAVNIDGVCSPAWNAIANEIIGSAHIMRAAINDLHVGELSADKIKAGTIMTPGVQIGGTYVRGGVSLDQSIANAKQHTEGWSAEGADNTQAQIDIGSVAIDKAIAGGNTFMSGGFINTDILLIDDCVKIGGGDSDGQTFIKGGFINTDIVKVKSKLVVGKFDYEEKIDGGPPKTATDNSSWEHGSNAAEIDGGKIHAGSAIIIGNTYNGDYCAIDDGDIHFYKYINGRHESYKSLKRIETGVAFSNIFKNIDGFFESEPSVIVSPQKMPTYKVIDPPQDQELSLYVSTVENIPGEGPYRWRFKGICDLTLGGGTKTNSLSLTKTDFEQTPYTGGAYTGLLLSSASFAGFPTLTRTLTVSLAGKSSAAKRSYSGYVQTLPSSCKARVRYRDAAGWHTPAWSGVKTSNGSWASFNLSVTSSRDILQAIVDVQTIYAPLEYDRGEGITGTAHSYLSVYSWQSNVSASTVIQSGTLNYVAIGK